MFWMLPNTNAYSDDYVVATIPSIGKNVTVANMSAILREINETNAAEAIDHTAPYLTNLDPPNVPVYLIYSDQLDTCSHFVYNGTESNWYNKDPVSEYGDGDDTVPIESLTGLHFPLYTPTTFFS